MNQKRLNWFGSYVIAVLKWLADDIKVHEGQDVVLLAEDCES